MTTQYTYDDNLISDLHKDAYGRRPSHWYYQAWKSWTPAQKQNEWNNLLMELEASMAREKEAEANAIQSFTQDIERTLAAGASDREQAIRWLAQAEGCNDGLHMDRERLEWQYGLPFGYINSILGH